jgi:hypothetical protein
MSNTPPNPADHTRGQQGNKFVLARLALGEDPVDYVTRMRLANKSLTYIANEVTQRMRTLNGVGDVSVTHETIRRWLRGDVPAAERDPAATAVTAVAPRADEHGVPLPTFQPPPGPDGDA